jgi:hypothetical protein
MAWTGKRSLSGPLVLLLLLSLCGVGGCLSRDAVEKQRYAVMLERASGATGPGTGVLRVSIVRAAPAFERKSFIYRRSENTFVSDFYNEFFSAPGVMLRENLIAWLGDSGIFEYVVATSDADPDWILESRLEALYGDGRKQEHLSAVVSLQITLLDASDAKRPIVMQQSYEAVRELADKNPENYLHSVEAALVSIFGELEADLRELIETHAASAEAPARTEEDPSP